MERGNLSLQPEDSEKRRHERVDMAEVPVRYKILNRKLALELLEPGTAEQDGSAVNLSMGGLCLATPSPLSKGDYLKIEITLPGSTQPTRAMAEVVWASTEGKAYKAGIRFLIVLKEADEDGIKSYLHSIDKD